MRNKSMKVAAAVALGAMALVSGCGKKPAPAPQIHVVEASYGLNCAGDVPGVPKRFDVAPGNVTSQVAQSCDGRTTCAYVVDVNVLKDPASECPKDFSVSFTCSADTTPHQVRIDPEANGHTATLSCAGKSTAG